MLRMRPPSLPALRAVLLAGIAVVALAAPGQAQAPGAAREEFFTDLQQLQDANLGIARQMSEIQRRAAALLEAAWVKAASGDTAQEEALTALVANALTLASVVLAPVATRDVAAGDVFSSLLEQNMALAAKVEPLFRGDPGLAEALAQYNVMQVQTQDLGLALRNGWSRYGRAVADAEAAGLLAPGSFDPDARDWSIALPDLAVADIPVEPAAGEERLAPDVSALDAPAFAVEPPDEITAAAEREAERLAEAAPAIAPAAEAGAAHPAALVASARPPAGEALALVDPVAPPATQPVTQPAAWLVMIGDNARAVAKAPNGNAATTGSIRGLQIGCHPNGTLRYVFEADREIGEFLVFANDERSATIRASGNMVAGSEAIRMSDVLRLAFEWASDAGENAHIMVAAADEPDNRAYFPVSGYLEARGRVLDGCLPWDEGDDPLAASAAPPAATIAAEPAPAEAEPAAAEIAAPVEAQPTATEPVAPVPRPRPAGRMPVDLMGAG